MGKLSAVYRNWSKSRRPHADTWEAEHDRPFFAAAAGSGLVDAVFRQALRQEAAAATGHTAVTVMEDMESFYESIDRDVLLSEASALGFPTCIIRACLAAYAAPRMISNGSALAKEEYATRGLIAGCSFATSLVKVFYLRKLEKVARDLPRGAILDAYIDDLAVSVEGGSAEGGGGRHRGTRHPEEGPDPGLALHPGPTKGRSGVLRPRGWQAHCRGHQPRGCGS